MSTPLHEGPHISGREVRELLSGGAIPPLLAHPPASPLEQGHQNAHLFLGCIEARSLEPPISFGSFALLGMAKAVVQHHWEVQAAAERYPQSQ